MANGLDDQVFIAAFEDASLATAQFHHDDHVRLAWLFLQQDELPAAINRFSTGLKKFAAAHGLDGLYHETITLAYLLLINERMDRQGEPQSWSDFAAQNPNLLAPPRTLLGRYYTEAALSAPRAREVFVFPDRAA